MGQHALASPSSAETWFGCPGSLAMQKGLPDDSNEYSDEGTAAHLLGSTCLETGKNPVDYAGRKIVVGYRAEDEFDGAIWYAEGTTAFELMAVRRTYTVDDEMIEAIGRYVDRVRQYATGAVLLMPERRVSIEPFTGEKDAHGTSDAAVVLPGELQVHDLKYGMGVRVSAKENKQLKMYALAVREELEIVYGPFERIRFIIHQPRISDAPDEWDCTAAELDAFALEVKAKASKALRIYGYGAITTGELVASEDACRWCKAKATCPELAWFVQEAAGADFEALAKPDVPQWDVDSEPYVLAKKMAAIPLIEDWCKAVRAELERQIFAGAEIPGWKIVQGKRGNRTWTDTGAAEALLKKMRLPIEERYKMTLNSPPAIEKVLKSTPRRWKRVLDAGLIEQRDGQPSVAPASDSRPAWTPPDTSNDFTAVTNNEEVAA